MSNTPIELVLSKLPDVKRAGKSWSARCPAHDDRRPSLSIAEGDDGRALVRCHAGCSVGAICAALGLRVSDLMPHDPVDVDRNRPRPGKTGIVSTRAPGNASQRTFPTAREAVADLEHRHGRRSAIWTYHDAHGEPVGLVVRWDTPDGKQIRPVARHGADWIIGGMPEPRPLYRLPDLADAKRVYVCEGEKCVEAARSIGLTATTSPHGSKSTNKADWGPLAGREVIVLPDNDLAGQAYAKAVAAILGHLTPAPVVKRVDLPNLPKGGDIVEWIDAHGDAAEPNELRGQLETLADAAEPILPDATRAATAPVLVKLADVSPKPIRWLWPGRVALGKLTLLAGDPGLGKSVVTLDIAARVTRAAVWPDDPDSAAPMGAVVLLSAEDDIADTIRPRLDAAGADVSRIAALTAVRGRDEDGDYTRPVDLSRDLHHVEAAIDRAADCRLVVIDPVTAYLGRTDSHKNAEIRGLLTPLGELAGRRGVAVLAVTHLRKSGGPAVYRSMGSLGFAAAARAVWAVAKDKEDPARRLLLPVKNNLGRDVLGLAYKVEPHAENDAPAIAWEPDPVDISADDALATDRTEDERDDAEEWLREALADGEMPAADVLNQGRSNAYSEKAIRKAFKAIGAERRREGFGRGGTWYWSLPAAPDDPAGP